MTIKEALVKYRKLEIDLLLAHLLGKSKEFLFMEPAYQLSANQLISLKRMIKRRKKGEPVAYILGYKDFMGLRFKVNRHVLIPRPETEMVIELILAKLRSSPPLGGMSSAAETERVRSSAKQPLPNPLPKRRGGLRSAPTKILDVGTGSGCIIISLAKHLSPCPCPSPSTFAKASADKQGGEKPQLVPPPAGVPHLSFGENGVALGERLGGGGYKFYGSDISSAALKVAKQNAKILLGRLSNTLVYQRVWPKVKFIKSDLLENIKEDFDIIIANLPYGWYGVKNRFSSVKDGLKYEPQQALYTEERGLKIIRQLLNQIADKKSKPKLVYLEFDPRQKQELSTLIKRTLKGSKQKFYKDFNNFWRYVEISCSIPSSSVRVEESVNK